MDCELKIKWMLNELISNASRQAKDGLSGL